MIVASASGPLVVLRSFRSPAVIFLLLLSLLSVLASTDASAEKKSGAALFKEHCAVCHPDGGNIVNPKKTLQKKDRTANKVMTETDIVALMRRPGPGMNAFDPKTLSDADAHAIAKYVIETFTK